MTRKEKKEKLKYSAYKVIPIIKDAEFCKEYGYDYGAKKDDIIFTKTILEELIKENETHEKKKMWMDTLKEINKFLNQES